MYREALVGLQSVAWSLLVAFPHLPSALTGGRHLRILFSRGSGTSLPPRSASSDCGRVVLQLRLCHLCQVHRSPLSARQYLDSHHLHDPHKTFLRPHHFQLQLELVLNAMKKDLQQTSIFQHLEGQWRWSDMVEHLEHASSVNGG